ncbi:MULTISPECIES: ImmA/IrrE family metallo-endopeptidase [Lactobacillus]|uniref:IrrE protein n=1 Tax=Myoviridae sp. ctk251 TaxID=2826689 RepID=A0A8S5MSH2_9CAUD|nr:MULTISPECIES: ImmA/IrrE family metallo-endopeptidase [Lactobacillus]DAD85281.1 MAG TPA: IrrE protein [Myoviridae sp. ctk251]EEX27759.1 putative toxin-antitoxin system, toxin component [Lactobacillus jensenii SJ-7A-US]MCF1778510.1 ImmA/IrrE family metallo-endopeptidase [Lactobacillus jensenii]MCF1797526.1 ImmA/IrrE family metallo-endopeptidase [Lactobacillus mulieris]MCF1843720.1 ImmA/IrrE family metallo-endopeptidase [Lactobacillus jensenii]
MDYDLALRKVLNKGFSYGVGFILESLRADFVSRCIPSQRKIILNTNTDPNKLPFIAGHELGHYVNGDNGICYYTPSSTLQAEAQADKYSVNLMYEIAEEQDIYFSNSIEFANAFSIPSNRLEAVNELAHKHKSVFYIDF